MDHQDLLALVRDGVEGPIWAELGSGEGNFTLALAELLGAAGTIYSVDRDGPALARQRDRFARGGWPPGSYEAIEADFTSTLALPALDGVLLANSLHFQRDKAPVLELVRGYLKPGGRLLLVEYDAERGNPWVPYPLSFERWKRVAADCGFAHTRRLATYPSRHLGAIYSALSVREP